MPRAFTRGTFIIRVHSNSGIILILCEDNTHLV